MELDERRAGTAVPMAAFTLAVGAAVLLGASQTVGFLSDAAEDLFIVTWILGWLMLAWAAILGGGYALLVVHRWRSRQTVTGLEAVLTAAALALVAVVLVSHPLWGTGSASATLG